MATPGSKSAGISRSDASQDHRGREQERVAGRVLVIEVDQQPGDDRRARARDPRQEREALREPDPERLRSSARASIGFGRRDPLARVLRRRSASPANITSALIIRKIATGIGEANSRAPLDWKSTPRMPTGIVPTTSSQPIRSSRSLREPAAHDARDERAHDAHPLVAVEDEQRERRAEVQHDDERRETTRRVRRCSSAAAAAAARCARGSRSERAR